MALVLSACALPVGAVDKSGVKPSVISLPSGPGSIEGLGESFEPQLNTGTSSYAIPLATLPGRAGFAPDLALVYNSGGGNDVLGLGWSMRLPWIQRQTDKGLPFYVDTANSVDDDKDGTVDDFDELDTLIHSSGEELVPLADGSWRCENEVDFTRFERACADAGSLPCAEDSDHWWIARRRDGVTLTFGASSSARVTRPTLGGTFRWQLERMEDPNGNVIAFVWSGPADGTTQVYLEEIRYNPHDGSGMVIGFVYETRPDPIVDHRPGFALITARRLVRIAMEEGRSPVRAYRLAYAATSSTSPHSLLASVTTEGRDGTSTLPPASFTYVPFDSGEGLASAMPTAPALTLGGSIDLLDLDGDALPDILDTSSVPIQPQSFFLNLGPDELGEVEWGPRLFMTASVLKNLGGANIQLADLDGDGRTDLSEKSGTTTQVWTLDDLEWVTSGFLTSSAFDLTDPDTRLVDLDHDKRVDVLQTSAGFTQAWLALGNGRFSSPFFGPAVPAVLRLSLPTTHLADMNGDRLLDLVRVDNGIATYVPALGRGMFGPLVTMANPPAGVADPSRLAAVDVNGDGLSDVVWVNGSSVEVRLNLGIPSAAVPTAGLLAPPFTVAGPVTTGSTQFRIADVNGNGSSDVLWNTPGAGSSTFAFVDFQPGEQPYQLKTITNGIGRTTTIGYGTSTAERQRDREAGQAWPLPTPTPIPVVKRIEVSDGREAVVYATELDYHDGFYDGLEREFRGFARAERREIGDDAQGAPTLVTAYEFDLGNLSEALKGKPLVVEARDELGEVFHRESQTWVASDLSPDLPATLPGDPRTVEFAFAASKRREVLERGLGTPVVLEWEHDYDNFGNEVLKAEYGRVEDVDESGTIGDSAEDRAAWDDERVTVATWSAAFPSGQAAWMLDRLVEQEIQDDLGTVFARQRHFYDDETFAGANLGEVSAGNRTMTRAWHDPSSPTGFVASSRTAFDSFGNPTHLYDPLWGTAPGHFREIVYDGAYHTFPVEEQIHTGNPDAPGDVLVLSASYDEGWGVVTCSTDFNDFETCYGYDTFGRLTSIVKPLDSAVAPTVEYDYVLAHDLGGGALINWVETRQREAAGGGTVDSRTFYDGLGRKVMTRAEGEDPGQVVVSDTVQFNARQQPWKKYLPYFELGSLDFVEPSFGTGHTRHEYDALAREIKATQPEGPGETPPVFSRITYEPLKRIVEDEEQTRVGSPHAGAKMVYVHDGLLDDEGQGRLREVHEVVKLTDDGHPGPLATWVTQYRWDVLDDFLGYTDSQNNKKHIFYDGLKRKVFMNDPDRSWMWYAYDAASNLVRTRDARGLEIAYGYDGVNRLLSEHYATAGENTGNTLGYNQRWTNPGPLPSRPADVAYHYDRIAGPVETGYAPPPRSTPEILVDTILGQQAPQPGFDLTGDGEIDTLDVARSVDLATKHATGKGSPPLIPYEVVTARNVRGYLAWVRDTSGEEHTSFDERGRAEWVVKKIRTGTGDMASFKTENDFDSMDRVTRLTYPDNTWIDYTYNPRGLLETIPTVVPRADYNSAGQLSRLDYQIGTVTSYSFDHRLRLGRIHTVRLGDGVALQDLNYSYDGVSNITTITDGRTDAELDQIGVELGISSAEARKFRETKALEYDDLYRLTRAANVAVWGELDYRYDRIGNLVRRGGGLLTPSPTFDFGELTYGGSSPGSGNAMAWGRDGRAPAAAPGPHAVSSIPAGADREVISYDERGQVIGGLGRLNLWDHKARLLQIDSTGSNRNFYDYSDRRVASIRRGVAVLYPFPHSDLAAPAGMHKSIEVGPVRVATVGGVDQYYFHDNVGSRVAGALAGGSLGEAAAFFPYGRTRAEARLTPPLGPQFAYSHAEVLFETVLDFGARSYEPWASQFLAVDEAFVEGLSPSSGIGFEGPVAGSLLLNPYAPSGRSPITMREQDGSNPAWADSATVAARAGVGYEYSSRLTLPADSRVLSQALRGQKTDCGGLLVFSLGRAGLSEVGGRQLARIFSGGFKPTSGGSPSGVISYLRDNGVAAMFAWNKLDSKGLADLTSRLKKGDILGLEKNSAVSGKWSGHFAIVTGVDSTGNVTLVHAGQKSGVVNVPAKEYLEGWFSGAKDGSGKVFIGRSVEPPPSAGP